MWTFFLLRKMHWEIHVITKPRYAKNASSLDLWKIQLKKKIFVLKSLVAFVKDNIAVRSPKYHYPQLLFWWILERSRSRCLQTYAANVKISSFPRMKPISFFKIHKCFMTSITWKPDCQTFLIWICDSIFDIFILKVFAISIWMVNYMNRFWIERVQGW